MFGIGGLCVPYRSQYSGNWVLRRVVGNKEIRITPDDPEYDRIVATLCREPERKDHPSPTPAEGAGE